MRGNFGLKLQNSPKLPHIHARLQCNAGPGQPKICPCKYVIRRTCPADDFLIKNKMNMDLYQHTWLGLMESGGFHQIMIHDVHLCYPDDREIISCLRAVRNMRRNRDFCFGFRSEIEIA